MRVGQSKDIHQLAEGRKLIIGGVDIPYEKGLLGHSDADVLIHAIIESLIGAMGLNDIGHHFPDNDEKYKDISSLILLDKTKELLDKNNYEIINIDSLVILEEPKLAKYINEMKKNIAEHLNIEETKINIKATRGEGLGFIGRKEGIMAEAISLINEVSLLDRLKKNNYSLLASNGYFSFDSGIKPVINKLNEKIDYFDGLEVADKAIGKANAMLFVLSGIKKISTINLSKAGREILDKYNIVYEYDKLVEYIINNEGNGMCPMELTVKDIDDLNEAYIALNNSLNKIKNNN